MKINLFFEGRRSILFVMSLTVIMISCSKDESISGGEVAEINAVSIADAYLQYVDDLTFVSMNGVINETGTFSIDYGAGDEDNDGNVLKGKLNFTYENGPATNTGYTIVLTFDNFTINDVKLEGERTYMKGTPSDESYTDYAISLTGGKITWPDNSFITQSSSLTSERDDSGAIHVTGTSGGLTKNGESYTAEITQTLDYAKTCTDNAAFIPKQGKETVTIGGTSFTIDYGDNTCDRQIVVTKNGATKKITVTKS